MMQRSLPLITVLLVAGCSSDSGSSNTALSVPSQMTIVDAKGSSGASPVTFPRPGRYAIEGSDYMTDPVHIWVHDESMEPLDLVNVILSSIEQTRFDDPSVFNAGPYNALVASDDKSADQNATAGRIVYDEFTVVSSRAGGDQPHIVKFWFDEEDDRGSGPPQPIRLYGRLTIFESPSAAHPFGRFRMSWKQLLRTDDPATGTPVMKGSLVTVDRTDGKAEFALHSEGGDLDGPIGVGEEAFRMRARVVTDASFTAGQAYTEMRFAHNEGSGKMLEGAEYYIQFNARYLARKKVSGGTDIQVLDRTDYRTLGYRYGVYRESDETRSRSDSGFPLETEEGAHGFAGYHGMWFPDEVTLTNGQRLIRRGHSGATTDYTAFIAPGRLEKQTRTNSTLGNLVNEPFVTWDTADQTDMKVVWTGSTLTKIATFDLGSGRWTSVTPISVGSQYSTDAWVHMHNDARGDVQFTWPSGGPTNDTTVVVWRRSIVNGDTAEMANGDLTLHAYFNMLKSNITSNQANYQSNETPYFPDATDVSEGKTYVFKKSTLTLQLGGNDVALGAGVKLTQGPRVHGLDCGPLVTTALASLNEMPAQVTTYSWMTGSDPWERYRTVKDANGAFVVFTPPLRLDYTHEETGNAYDGKSFTLELEGDELHGIPFDQDQDSGRWYPGFTIPHGAVVTDGQGTRYLLKMIEGEQSMNAVVDPDAVIASEGFDLDLTLAAPGSSYVDPAVGARPVVTGAPKFVEGVAQD